MGQCMIVIDAIIRTKRKSISLIISPQGKLVVRAPINCSLSYIDSIVKKRSEWITTNQNKVKKQNELNKDILTYKNVLYLGKVFRLALADNIKTITVYNDAIYIPYKMPKDKIKRNLVKWYKQKALALAQQHNQPILVATLQCANSVLFLVYCCTNPSLFLCCLPKCFLA